MSKLLIQLLNASEREFRLFIDRLEQACLHPGIDIRLGGEIINKTRDKTAALGLDAIDTTPRELFFVLKSRLKEDDAQLKKLLKLDGKTPEQIAKKLARQATNLSSQDYVLAMTIAGTKRVLQAVPPRKTLRLLSLRSLESVLKRDDPRVLYALATQLEDASWRSQVHAKMKRLQSKDITWLPVEVIAMPAVWYSKTRHKLAHRGTQLVCPEVGAVVVLPLINSLSAGATILAMGLILQAAQRLAHASVPYRRRGFLQGYHNILLEIAHGHQPALSPIHGLNPSWRAVHELLSKSRLKQDLSELEPATGNAVWQSIEMKLASLLPQLDFWVDTHYLAVVSESGPVSMHLLDVARAVIVEADFGQQPAVHLIESLSNELHLRYLQQDILLKSLGSQLSSSDVDVLL